MPSSTQSGTGIKIEALPEENLMMNYLQLLKIIIIFRHWSFMVI